MNDPPHEQENSQDEWKDEDEEHELDLFAQLPQEVWRYRARTKVEGLVLKFHVFCDRTDDFTAAFADAMALYWQHRYEGQPNVRIYIELQDSEGTEQYEDCLLAYGDFPT